MMVGGGSECVYQAAALTILKIPPFVSELVLVLSASAFLHLCFYGEGLLYSLLAFLGSPHHIGHRWLWLVCCNPGDVFFHSHH